MSRLLVSAFSYGPGRGSEPGLGWHSVEELAREHEVCVLVDIGCMAALEGYTLPTRVTLVPVRLPLLSWLLVRYLHHGVFWLIYYYLWQFVAVAHALRLHQQHAFHAAVHVTYAKYSVPTLLPLLGVPVIFGPVGGAERAPLVFFQGLGLRVWLEEALRLLVQKIAQADPLLRWSLRRCSLVLGTTPESAAALRALGARRVGMRQAIALSEADLAALAEPQQKVQRRLLYVGRVLAWKGLHLVIEAMARSPGYELQIIGSGPATRALEEQAHRLKVTVTFLGELPREEVLRHYGRAEALVHPSLHDSGATSVLEAMAAGLPVLCLNYGGPAVIVDADCGWCIPASTPQQAVDGLAAALAELPTAATTKGAAARAKAQRECSWQQRGEQSRAEVKQRY